MPDLVLTEDQKQYQQLAREFAEKEIAPHAERYDHEGVLPVELLKKAWELGLFNVRIPESYGGFGLTLTDAGLIAEELGAACTAISSAFEGNELAIATILEAGSAEQKEEYLSALTASFVLAGYCTEPCSYEKKGDEYLLSGESVAINATTSQWLIVTAGGADGESIFVVANDSSIKEGATVAYPFGRKAGDIRRISFKACAAQLLGKPGNAQAVMERADIASHVYVAAEAVGLCRSALTASVKYAKERITMGVPIGNHQGVAFMLADMAKDTEAGRLLWMKAAWQADSGSGTCAQSAVAKVFAIDAAMKVATDAVQVFGGYGYMKEYPVEKLMRDAKVFQMFGAGHTAHDMKVQLGKQLVGASKAPGPRG